MTYVVWWLAVGCTSEPASPMVEDPDPPGTSNVQGPTAPEAPVVQVTWNPQGIVFAWNSDADFHELYELDALGNRQRVVTFEELGSSFTLPVSPLYRFSDTTFVLDACNAEGCTPSEPLVAQRVDGVVARSIKASAPEGGAELGAEVALSGAGDVLVAGLAGRDQVYLYRRTGDGWAADAVLSGPSEAHFGHSVAIAKDGSTLVVGAPDAEDGGLVIVFEYTGTEWVEAERLPAPETPDGQFGFDLALEGEWLVVGDPQHREDDKVPGAAHVYRRLQEGWTLEDTLLAPNRADGDEAGFAVAIDVDGSFRQVLVGAPGQDGAYFGTSHNPYGTWGGEAFPVDPQAGAPDSGAVFVFTDAGHGLSPDVMLKPDSYWDIFVTLTDPLLSPGDRFGSSIAVGDGCSVIVGAPGDDLDPAFASVEPVNDRLVDSGGYYRYSPCSYTGWQGVGPFKPVLAAVSDGWGASVAWGGGDSEIRVVAVGATSPIAGGSVWVETQDVWYGVDNHETSLAPPFAGPGDRFGAAIAFSADGLVMAVGAPGDGSSQGGIGSVDGDDGAPASGAVFLY